jgi:predicted metalloprotease
MRWEGREQSDNIEDVRGSGGGMRKGAGISGIGLVIILGIALITGQNPLQLLGAVQQQAGPAVSSERAGPYQESPEEAKAREFTSVVLNDTETVWGNLFRERGMTYAEPKLQVFAGQVQTACGAADSNVGPFYCGADQKVYIDLSFYNELSTRFGAPGEFANAYVVAHEVGHHVQNLLGTMDKVNRSRARMSEREANALSVRLELQADYYAGVWAHHAKDMANITDADIRDGLNAASQIGDDTLQKAAQGYVQPDRFTHGTSQQRVRWFLKGWKEGTLEGGDTFSVRNP